MAKFKTRLIFLILVLIIFVCLALLIFIFQKPENVLTVQTQAQLKTLILLAIFITVAAIIAAFAAFFILSAGITRPIMELNKATQAISELDFNQQLKVRSYAEIQELITNFNHMAGQLKIFQQQTKRQHRGLEKIAREKTKELNYIYRIGQEVSSTLELEQVLDTVARRTAEILDLKICTILLVDEGDTKLEVLRAEGTNLKKIKRQVVKRGEGISGWVWSKKDALLVKDVDQDNRFIARTKEKYYTGNLISAPLEAKGRIIGVINGNNKFSAEPFKPAELLLLQEIATESAIAIENALLYKNLKNVYVHTIAALASALETKDHYTSSHSENVTRYAVAIAQEFGLSAEQVEVIRQACQLHDLGKIGIHDYILAKKGKLSDEEWDEIKLHALRGAQIIQPIDFLNEVSELVRQHHERFDGQGYPGNLSGQEIQLGARIMAVADSFDAMISARPYRRALTLNQAVAELRINSGLQFDPGIVNVFLKLIAAKPELLNLG
ncbi:HD domain-containing phosphohydrolase [Candidatus Omnitrophota bacterium]